MDWCAGLSVHPFDAQRHHVSAWVRSLPIEVQGNGKTSTNATVARRLSALSASFALAVELQGELGPEVTVWYQGLGDQRRPVTQITATTSPADTTEST